VTKRDCENVAQDVAQTIFWSKLIHILSVEKKNNKFLRYLGD
jgi:acetone carboxylase gamma subunit